MLPLFTEYMRSPVVCAAVLCGCLLWLFPLRDGCVSCVRLSVVCEGCPSWLSVVAARLFP
ncbi:MAG: hypothetical protein OHK006_11910 [Thermodesulfovibrionales bacterium]